ncbi:hypothetical protein SAMN05216219_1569 [Mycetocola miduiensis]|uniref:Uncharacterized protein n=1 Tax=Mycetocola miduiensis TaxID=995034 RepID=A0A1I5AVQ4_9MICO|nr:hypothetical protein SAMN05216219_1569 [Mycetocola miduiensis]
MNAGWPDWIAAAIALFALVVSFLAYRRAAVSSAAYWVLEADRSAIDSGIDIAMTLSNRGDSRAHDVEMVIDFDPGHVFLPKGTWSFVDRQTDVPYRGTDRAMRPVISRGDWNESVLASGKPHATVTWRAPYSRKRRESQTIPLPEIR